MYTYFLIIFELFIFLFIFMHIHNLYLGNLFIRILLYILTTLLIINDFFIRPKSSKNSLIKYDYSLLFTILGAAVLRFSIMETETISYLIFPLIEIFNFEGTKLKHFLYFHFVIFIALLSYDIGFPTNFDKLANYVATTLSYSCISYTSYSMALIKKEKAKIKKLNEELSVANEKLQQYALEIERLTISKERNQIAQEIHDSLGHYLIALSLQLDFARKICNKDIDKLDKVLEKSQNITKVGIHKLRESVSLLKNEANIMCFNASIEHMIRNFNIIDGIKINYNFENGLDKLSINIKNSLYKIIEESITNSIKHGQATEITININLNSNSIKLIIYNNGARCINLKKSNGLLGMEHRINLLNGSIDYYSTDKYGFYIKIIIPILMEELLK